MMKSILVGLDGSPYSERAVEFGIRWARKFDALLVGLGIIDEPTIRMPEAMPIGASYFKASRDEAKLADARRRVDQFLERFSIRCAEAGVSSKVLEDVGHPAQQIVTESQRFDVILLGRQTYFQFETQEGVDNTIKEVLKSSPRPVVTVPAVLKPGQCVLAAYDGSLQASRSLQLFQALEAHEGMDVHVLSVADNHVEAARHADRAAEFLRFHDVKAHTHAVASGQPPAKVILEYVHKLSPGLLVMGAYGKSTWREFFFGTVTKVILKDNPVPVFLYH